MSGKSSIKVIRLSKWVRNLSSSHWSSTMHEMKVLNSAVLVHQSSSIELWKQSKSSFNMHEMFLEFWPFRIGKVSFDELLRLIYVLVYIYVALNLLNDFFSIRQRHNMKSKRKDEKWHDMILLLELIERYSLLFSTSCVVWDGKCGRKHVNKCRVAQGRKEIGCRRYWNRCSVVK